MSLLERKETRWNEKTVKITRTIMLLVLDGAVNQDVNQANCRLVINSTIHIDSNDRIRVTDVYQAPDSEYPII